MNLVTTAPLWLLAVLCAALVAAAIEDVLRRRVSNLTVAVVALAAIAAMAFAGWSVDLWQNVLVFVAVLAIGTMMFATGKMGGGDIKLLAALGLWVDLRGSLALLASVFIAGGLLAVAIIAWRLMRKRRDGQKLRDGKNIPYAVAIAAGGLFLILAERHAMPF